MNKISICRQCGDKLPKDWKTDICLSCSKENAKKIFEEYPEIKEAFLECIKMIRNECGVSNNDK